MHVRQISKAFFPKFYGRQQIFQNVYLGRDRFANLQCSDRTLSNVKDVPTVESPLLDAHGRFHEYLRISITERCNLRCHYCMPEEGVTLSPTSNLLTIDEILRLVKLFASLGVVKIRLTGGEPTIRKDLLQIIKGISTVPQIKQLGMTSNGVVLAKQLVSLWESGLNRLNISLDTLEEKKFAAITRRNGFNRVMNLIHLAETMFTPLKLNCVIMRGLNDDEVLNFVEFTRNLNVDIRFIEYMPFGGNDFDHRKMVPYKEILAKIFEKYDENVEKLEDARNDTSKAFKIKSYKGQFGFITSMSEHFCGTCNRLRITADGNLKVCLHGNAEVSLRDKMRKGCDDNELTQLISEAVKRKKPQHAGMINLMKMTNRPMILIADFTHIDEHGRAQMVDVSVKKPTERIALARAKIYFAKELFVRKVIESPKGDLYGVARIAGIQAAKKTSELIPLCHQIPLSDVKIAFATKSVEELEVYCRAKSASSLTGVEMEALVGCSIAALTVYDMCKALGFSMKIGELELLGKFGGKRDFGHIEISDYQ